MQPLAVFMMFFSILLFLFSLMISHGETGLIRTFKFTKVKDEKKYAKFLGTSLAKIAGIIFLCAILSMFIDARIVLVIFIVLFIAEIILMAKKANDYY